MTITIKSPKESAAVVHMNKATFHAYIFHLFYGAGYACLLPFLSLYFRYLGLTASQVGMVFGAKAAVNMIWAPCWTRCSTKFRKKRFVLVFSMLILLGTYGLMIIIPPADRELSNLRFCPNQLQGVENFTAKLENLTEALTAKQNIRDQKDNGATLSTTSTAASPEDAVESRDMIAKATWDEMDPDVLEILKKNGINENSLTEMDKAVFAKIVEGILKNIRENGTKTRERRDRRSGYNRKSDAHRHKAKPAPSKEDPETTSTVTTSTTLSTTTMTITVPTTTLSTTTQESATATTSATTSGTTVSVAMLPSSTTLDSTKNTASPTSSVPTTTTAASLATYISQEQMYKYMAILMNRVHELPGQMNTVICVMALIIVGEMFSAPAEKLADDTWFEFLDSSDVLEKYGTHKMWLALGCALVPPMLTLAIDRLPCILTEIGHFEIHRLLLHFFAFYVLMGLAFFFSVCFPIFSTSDGKKVLQRRGRFCRGLRMLFNDVHVSAYTISILLMGFVHGATGTFLFWLVQDKAGAEQIMGFCLTAAFAGEFLMQGFGRWLVSKIGYAVCVVFGLLVLGGRYAFYSLISDPIYIIAGEGLHFFSVSLIWAAVRTYPDFRLNPLVMDRSANSVINSFYHGFGLAPGCFIAGYIYDWVGLPILFQSCSVLCGVWAIIFTIIQCCSRKTKKVRYAKLLQDEEEAEALSDGSMEYDDDWLEVAMKHQK